MRQTQNAGDYSGARIEFRIGQDRRSNAVVILRCVSKRRRQIRECGTLVRISPARRDGFELSRFQHVLIHPFAPGSVGVFLHPIRQTAKQDRVIDEHRTRFALNAVLQNVTQADWLVAARWFYNRTVIKCAAAEDDPAACQPFTARFPIAQPGEIVVEIDVPVSLHRQQRRSSERFRDRCDQVRRFCGCGLLGIVVLPAHGLRQDDFTVFYQGDREAGNVLVAPVFLQELPELFEPVIEGSRRRGITKEQRHEKRNNGRDP